MLRKLTSALLAVAALALIGCDWDELNINIGSGRYTEDFHYTYAMKPGGRLSLENFNGSVEITGWEKDSVEVSGTKYASSKEMLHLIKVDVVAAPGSVQIRTVRPFERRGNLGARYVIRAPRKVELDRVVSSNGGIRIQDIQGSGRLHTSNGQVHVQDCKGDLEVVTSNGPIEVIDSLGRAVLKTSNGSIKAAGVSGRLEATTSNGSIHARLREIDPQYPVRLESSNGSIRLEMETMKGNQIQASTRNSPITVQLPASASARIHAAARNSSVTTEFDVDVRNGQRTKHELDGTIGAGGPRIDLSTSNGSIRILKL